MRSNHSTRTKAWGKARAASRESAQQLERAQAKVKTKSGTHPNLIARAQAPGKPEKDPELERAREKVATQRNVTLREQATLEAGTRLEAQITETRSGLEIARTISEISKGTKPQCTPAKEPELQVAVLLTGHIR